MTVAWPSTASFGFETARPRRYDGERTGPDDRRSAGSRTPRGSPAGPPLDRVENNIAVVIRFFSSLLGAGVGEAPDPTAPRRIASLSTTPCEVNPDYNGLRSLPHPPAPTRFRS